MVEKKFLKEHLKSGEIIILLPQRNCTNGGVKVDNGKFCTIEVDEKEVKDVLKACEDIKKELSGKRNQEKIDEVLSLINKKKEADGSEKIDLEEETKKHIQQGDVIIVCSNGKSGYKLSTENTMLIVQCQEEELEEAKETLYGIKEEYKKKQRKETEKFNEKDVELWEILNGKNTEGRPKVVQGEKPKDKPKVVQGKKRDLKNKPNKKEKRFWSKKLLPWLLALGLTIVVAETSDMKEQNGASYSGEGNPQTTENSENNNEINEILNNFKSKYLEKYNEVYKTDYSSAEVHIFSVANGEIYKAGGKYVTKGENPNETNKFLEENVGEVSTVNNCKMVLQITTTEPNGEMKILGTYNSDTGEFIYSGFQFEDITDKDFKVPNLEDLGFETDIVTKLSAVLSSQYNESRESSEQRIKEYKKTYGNEGTEEYLSL